MTFHIVAHYIKGQGVTEAEPTAIQDDVLTISVGTRFYIPAEYNYVHYIHARGRLLASVRLSTPSIEARRLRYYVMPVNIRYVFQSEVDPVYAKYSPPIELVPTEELRYLVSLRSASSAEDHVILTVLGPREPRRGQPADLRIARGTFSVNVNTPWVWTSVAPVLDVPLEAGQYNLWGALVSMDCLVAARLLIYGQVWRPPAIDYPWGDPISYICPRELFDEFIGYLLGTFDHMHVPQLQILPACTGTLSGVVYFFIERVR